MVHQDEALIQFLPFLSLLKKYLHDIVMDSEASEGGKGKNDKNKGG